MVTKPGSLTIVLPRSLADRLRAVYEKAGFTTATAAGAQAIREWVEHQESPKNATVALDDATRIVTAAIKEALREEKGRKRR